MNEYDSNRIFDTVKNIGFYKTEKLEETNIYLLKIHPTTLLYFQVKPDNSRLEHSDIDSGVVGKTEDDMMVVQRSTTTNNAQLS